MPFEAFLLLFFLGATFAAFFFELLPVDVTALTLLLALLASGLVPLEEGVAGFSNQAVLTIAGLFILSHALMKTGLLEVAGERLTRRFGRRRWIGISALLGLVALMSAFLNNTAVVAMTIPLGIEICKRLGISPSKVLMPLSFAAIFGGTLTLIGTSTNLLVSSIVMDAGQAPLGMFEFTRLGAIFLALGLGYVILRAPRALPERASVESLTSDFQMASYLTELRVVKGSKLVGSTVQDIRMSERYDVTMLALLRGAKRITENLRTQEFQVGDTMVVRGSTGGLLRLRTDTGVALLSDVKMTDEELTGSDQVVVEALVGPNSGLIGRTLEEMDFRRSYGGFVLAVRRAEFTLRERLARTPLRFADTLLIVTSRDRLRDLRRADELLVVSEIDLRLRRERLWWLPLLLIPLAMLLAATGVVDLLIGVLASVVLLLGLGVLKPLESYRAVNWSVIVFIAAFIPVGEAMFRTGLADLLAAGALIPGAYAPPAAAPWVAVAVLYLITSLATETVTNNAAAIILTPVALAMASELAVDPRPLIIAVCFAASASFMTPTGYQTNMMVYGAGNYRFTDFTRFGAPLNLLFWLVASLLIPVLFPFS